MSPLQQQQLEGPVSHAMAGPVALSLCALGFSLAGSFVVAEGRPKKSVVVSVLLAVLSSATLAFGLVFLLQWVGIFV